MRALDQRSKSARRIPLASAVLSIFTACAIVAPWSTADAAVERWRYRRRHTGGGFLSSEAFFIIVGVVLLVTVLTVVCALVARSRARNSDVRPPQQSLQGPYQAGGNEPPGNRRE